MSTDLDKLERLHALFEHGALSEEEYQREKARVLSTAEVARSPTCAAPLVEPVADPASEYDAEEAWEDEEPVASKLPLIVIAIVLIAVCGGAYWFLAFKGNETVSGSAASVASIKASPPDSAASQPAANTNLPSKGDLLGRPYGVALQGTPYDPAAGFGAEGNFDETLSGPQTPSIAFRFDGKEVLIWENCKAHLCPDTRSIIGIEVGGPGRFVATIVNGQTEILRNAWFGRELLSHCTGYTCEFDGVAEPMGQEGDIAPLTSADLNWAKGGVSCRAENSAGQMVFYTEGEAAIRFKGRLRQVSETDGIGVGPWYSEDGIDDSLEVNIEERDGPSRNLEEGMSYPALLKVFDGAWTSIPVSMTCEA